MRKVFCLILLFFNAFLSYTQIIYGVNNYTSYLKGTLPIIISVPHGGNLKPESIPDRTCNDPTLVTDLNTIELANQIDTAFVNATGCHPHIIYCHLKRTKIDCNRDLADGACGNLEAETAWNEFHDFIDTAEAIALDQFNGKAFYIDLHGHGHSIQQLELGYLYTATELAKDDSVLNTPLYESYNSIQHLVQTNVNGYTNAEMIRGTYALGSLLTNAGFPAVPSMQTPIPGTNPYFNGGYNTVNYTSYASGNTVDGLQIECNSEVRNSYLNRKAFADSLVSVLINYLSIHQDSNLDDCNLTTSSYATQENSIIVSPNPAVNYFQISFSKEPAYYEIELINVYGQAVLKTANKNELDVSELTNGIYFVKVYLDQRFSVVKKIFIY